MTWRDYVRIAAGVVMFVLGIVGLVLPVLQGVLFLIISAILLAPYSRWVAKQLDRGERRFPWVAAKARSITRRDEAFCLDVVQDVMMIVVKKMPRLETEAALRAWMARTVSRAVTDRLRSEARRRRREAQRGV